MEERYFVSCMWAVYRYRGCGYNTAEDPWRARYSHQGFRTCS